MNTDAYTYLVYQQETCFEELLVEKAVKKAIMKADDDSEIVNLWNATLSHIDDIPSNLSSKFPQSYTNFRNKTDRVPVYKTFATPKKGDLPQLDPQTSVEVDALEYMPDLVEDFNFSQLEANLVQDERSVL